MITNRNKVKSEAKMRTGGEKESKRERQGRERERERRRERGRERERERERERKEEKVKEDPGYQFWKALGKETSMFSRGICEVEQSAVEQDPRDVWLVARKHGAMVLAYSTRPDN